jgi:hypothetical protein
MAGRWIRSRGAFPNHDYEFERALAVELGVSGPIKPMRQIRLLALASSALWFLGCATVRPIDDGPVSAENANYSTGRAIQDFRAAPTDVGNAVAEALGDLKMEKITRGRNGTVLKIDGRTEDNRLVTVTIRHNNPLSRVSCRVGWFGDEPLSKAILERTGVRLGTLPPAPIPERPPSRPSPNPYFSREAIPDSVMLGDVADSPYRDRLVP